MKPARTMMVISAVLLVALLAAALAAYGGTADDPEVGDSTGDSTTGRDSHDVTAAWVDAEENSTVTIKMRMTALDAVSPRDDWLNLPTSIYEFYFTIKEDDYALRSNVPVHGPFAAFTGYSLYKVEYGETGNMTYENVGSVNGQYLVNDGDISFLIDKTDIGSPSKGDLMENMWAAIYFQPRGGSKETVDEALSYEFPGRKYIFRGEFTQLYDVRVTASNTTVETPNNAVASFNITLRSDSTTDVEVNMTNRSLPSGYFVNWSRAMPVPVNEGDTASFFLLVTVPENATNGTDLTITIWGVFLTEEGQELETEYLNLILKVRFIPPKKPKEEKSILQQIFDFFQDNMWLLYLIIVAVAFGVIYLLWNARKKRQEDALLDQYKAYIESQGEQRETGETY
jgi:hypothetical protein